MNQEDLGSGQLKDKKKVGGGGGGEVITDRYH